MTASLHTNIAAQYWNVEGNFLQSLVPLKKHTKFSQELLTVAEVDGIIHNLGTIDCYCKLMELFIT